MQTFIMHFGHSRTEVWRATEWKTHKAMARELRKASGLVRTAQ